MRTSVKNYIIPKKLAKFALVMRLILRKYMMLVAALFVLVHVFVPHHHHQTLVSIELAEHANHCAEHGEEVGEQMIFSAIVEEDNTHAAFLCANSQETGEHAHNHTLNLTGLRMPATAKAAPRHFGHLSVGGLRAPPAC